MDSQSVGRQKGFFFLIAHKDKDINNVLFTHSIAYPLRNVSMYTDHNVLFQGPSIVKEMSNFWLILGLRTRPGPVDSDLGFTGFV